MPKRKKRPPAAHTHPDFGEIPYQSIRELINFASVILYASGDFDPEHPDYHALKGAIETLHAYRYFESSNGIVAKLVRAGYLIGAHVALPETLAHASDPKCALAAAAKRNKRSAQDALIAEVLEAHGGSTGHPWKDAERILENAGTLKGVTEEFKARGWKPLRKDALVQALQRIAKIRKS